MPKRTLIKTSDISEFVTAILGLGFTEEPQMRLPRRESLTGYTKSVFTKHNIRLRVFRALDGDSSYYEYAKYDHDSKTPDRKDIQNHINYLVAVVRRADEAAELFRSALEKASTAVIELFAQAGTALTVELRGNYDRVAAFMFGPYELFSITANMEDDDVISYEIAADGTSQYACDVADDDSDEDEPDDYCYTSAEETVKGLKKLCASPLPDRKIHSHMETDDGHCVFASFEKPRNFLDYALTRGLTAVGKSEVEIFKSSNHPMADGLLKQEASKTRDLYIYTVGPKNAATE